MAAVTGYTNNPSTTATGSGGGGAILSTDTTFTVASSSAFPPASTGTTQFHIADPAAPTELITVTNVSGTTWTVARGAESTTAVAHSSGATFVQVVTAGDLAALLNGNSTAISLPGTLGVTGLTTASKGVASTAGPLTCSSVYNVSGITNSEHLVINLPLVAGALVAGSQFAFSMFATFEHDTSGTTANTFTFRAGTAGTVAGDTSLGTVTFTPATASATTVYTVQLEGLITVTASGSSGTANVGIALSQTAAIFASAGISYVATGSLTSWNTTTATFLDISFTSGGAANTLTVSQASLQQVK